MSLKSWSAFSSALRASALGAPEFGSPSSMSLLSELCVLRVRSMVICAVCQENCQWFDSCPVQLSYLAIITRRSVAHFCQKVELPLASIASFHSAI